MWCDVSGFAFNEMLKSFKFRGISDRYLPDAEKWYDSPGEKICWNVWKTNDPGNCRLKIMGVIRFDSLE